MLLHIEEAQVRLRDDQADKKVIIAGHMPIVVQWR